MTKVKLEIDDDFDISQLKREKVPTNADVDQLAEIERKEDEDLENFEGDEDILQSLNKRNATINSSITVKDFIYDKDKHHWCCIKFEVPIKFKNIDMTNVLREASRTSIIWQVPKIKRAFTHKMNDVLVVTTDGINIGVNLANQLRKLYLN